MGGLAGSSSSYPPLVISRRLLWCDCRSLLLTSSYNTVSYHSGLDACSQSCCLCLQRSKDLILNVCAGSALFFEVRHYKAQEKRFSTLGWSFVPVEVLVDHSSSPSGFGATSRYKVMICESFS